LQDLSIYVHYPFCKSKCPYCDFNSHVNKQVDDNEFALAYEKELEHFAPQLSNRKIKSIFFGGGTPSLMPVDLTQRILTKISDLWQINEDVEITLEANPTSFEATKFKDFKSVGINRLSIGIQALNDKDLKFLGREHSAKEAIDTIKTASKIFDNYSFDLIYARPEQELVAWRKELDEAIKLSPNHLSLYQLTIEKGTPFYASHKKNEFQIPGDDLAADFYELTNDITSKNSLDLYEISNYSKKGSECKHNLVYWQSEDYLGIGPGAHSRVYFDGSKNRSKIMTYHAPNKWQDSVLTNGDANQEIRETKAAELLDEIVLMGLRLRSGIDNKIFEKHFEKKYQDLFDIKALDNLINQGFLLCCGDKMVVTPKGRILTNSVIEKVIDSSNEII
jgi:oxygen-independent coproporphyrinogen-3 oxidase